MTCSLELNVGTNSHTMLAFPTNTVINMTLSSLKQVLDKVKSSYPAWFGLLHPHSLQDTKEVSAVLREGTWDSTKVPGTDPSC